MNPTLIFICLLLYNTVILAGFPSQEIKSKHSLRPLELIFWHSMAGSLGEEVKSLTQAFNQSQNKFLIKPVYKGDYIETLTSFAASFRPHRPPDFIQVFEVGTAHMLYPQGIIKPVDDMMNEQSLLLPKEDFIKSVREFYSLDGKLMAMPFNLSAPVLFYNKNALAKIGYSSANFPKTWDELEHLAQRLKQAGYQCAYTSAYPGWILIEAYMAIHQISLLAQDPMRAVLDTPNLLQHLQRLKRWQDLSYFKYGGRVDDATVLFTSGLCPLFSQSSGAYNSLSKLTSYPIGVAALPLDTKVSLIRHANVAGGAALWPVAGLSKEQYRGIAQFFVFLAKPEVQKRWHEHTGYIPIGLDGIYAKSFQTSTHPVIVLAKHDLNLGNAKIPRIIGPQNQIRHMNDELLEAMFAGLIQTQECFE